MTFGERIKQTRLKQHLTMAKVAQAVGVSEATVSRWESGDILNMRCNMLVPLCKALGTDPNTLIGWENETDRRKYKVKIRKVR